MSASPWDAALNPPPPPVLTYDGQVQISVRYLTGTGNERRPWIEGVDPESDRKIGVLVSLTPILGGEVLDRTILVSNPDWKDYTLPSVYKCQNLTPGASLPPGVQNPLEALNGQYVRLKLMPRQVKFRDGHTVTMRSLIFDHVYESQAQCWEMAQHSAPAATAPVQPVPSKNGAVPTTPYTAQETADIASGKYTGVKLPTDAGPVYSQPTLPTNVIHALPDGTWIVLWQSGKSQMAATQEEAELVAAGPEPQP